MEQRKLGMDEVMTRLEGVATSYTLNALLRLPGRPLGEDDIPGVLVATGRDRVVEYSKRGPLGYPCRRGLEVVIECWDSTTGDVWQLYEDVRKAVLAQKGILIAQRVTIFETGAFGPFNNNFTTSEALQLLLEMRYTDIGPDFTT